MGWENGGWSLLVAQCHPRPLTLGPATGPMLPAAFSWTQPGTRLVTVMPRNDSSFFFQSILVTNSSTVKYNSVIPYVHVQVHA